MLLTKCQSEIQFNPQAFMIVVIIVTLSQLVQLYSLNTGGDVEALVTLVIHLVEWSVRQLQTLQKRL